MTTRTTLLLLAMTVLLLSPTYGEAAELRSTEGGIGATGTTCLAGDDFVKREGARFTLGGQEFVFSGWNQWEIMEAASGAPPPFRNLPKLGRDHITNVMNQGVENGLKVMRVWASTITEGWETYDYKDGVVTWNEQILQGMDFILDEAAKRDLKVIWALLDNWYPVGGVQSYVDWAGGSGPYDFFTNEKSKEIYREVIRVITSRVNTINGRVYRDDPTIMGWNLANEVRCPGCDSSVIQNWIEEMCPYLKSQDPNHLVAIGYEGFYGPDSGKSHLNPGKGGSDWAAQEGQDFEPNSQVSCIDYVGFHVWPDNWNLKTTEFMKEFIRGHIEDAKAWGKPVILEEFGKIVEDPDHVERDKYFRAAYEEAVASMGARDLDGVLFWHWYDDGIGPGRYGVYTTDTTFDIIRENTAYINDLTGTPKTCAA